ncbi:RapZ C-terminal domain-containing protein [Nocardiopsis alba]
MRIPNNLRKLTDKGLVKVVIVSYGVRHGAAPRPNTRRPVKVDLTTALRNPADDPRMIQMTGLDAKVRKHVLATPGARRIIEQALEQTGKAMLAAPKGELVEVFTFCQGGRHRSVAVAEELAAALRANGINCEVEHRDIKKPVRR